MSESIYTQLENQTVVTPVNGKDYRHEIPAGLFPDDKTFENPEKLIAWADEWGHTAKLIQKGLQKAIIEVRAAFKACPKEKIWTEEMGQNNVTDMEWKTVDRPNVSGAKKVDQARNNDCMAMFGTLAQSGMEKDLIKTSLIAVYGEELVEDIFATLEK